MYISGEYNAQLSDGKNVERPVKHGDGKDIEKDREGIVVHEDGRPFEEWIGPRTVVNYSNRTLKPILLPNATDDYQFGHDSYIVKVIR